MTEELIVKGCLRGDRRYQQTLYEKYKVGMFSLLLRYASNKEEAEDFLQDGFLRVFRDLHQFDPRKGVLHGWIRRVMINTALQHIRRRKLDFTRADDEGLLENIPVNEDPIAMLTAQEIIQLIQQLPEGYRVVFNLFMIEGYSHQEIAEQLGISVNTSKSQLYKARLALQQKIMAFVSA